MVSPFAIRLAITTSATAGAVAGRFYALSTAGSLLGTFLPALVLIPLDRHAADAARDRGVLALSARSCSAGGCSSRRRRSRRCSRCRPGAVKAEDGAAPRARSRATSSSRCVERDDGSGVLYLNEGVAVHSVWRPDTVLTGGVWDAFLAVPPLLDRPLRAVAMLGNAGGTIARASASTTRRPRSTASRSIPAVSGAAAATSGSATTRG